jgi:hypothetical protein
MRARWASWGEIHHVGAATCPAVGFHLNLLTIRERNFQIAAGQDSGAELTDPKLPVSR